MSIVSFWSKDNEETGKTSAIIALATFMAIEHNYKILVVSTSYKDNRMQNAFFGVKRTKKNLGLFGPNTNVALENGIEGLNRFIKSNKVTPDIITNYTKIVFKDRLEMLLGYNGEKRYYDELKGSYPSVIELANRYYDLVLVDIDSSLEEQTKNDILRASNLVVATLSQRLENINEFNDLREKNELFASPKTLILVGRYDKFSKYTSKNISRYLKEKNEATTLPYNTLFFEACEEAAVPDFFLKLRRIKDDSDKNAFFIKEVNRLSENIIYRLQDLQMRTR